jgi:fatty acid desaturase
MNRARLGIACSSVTKPNYVVFRSGVRATLAPFRAQLMSIGLLCGIPAGGAWTTARDTPVALLALVLMAVLVFWLSFSDPSRALYPIATEDGEKN